MRILLIIGVLVMGGWGCAPVGLGSQVPRVGISPGVSSGGEAGGWWVVAAAVAGVGIGLGVGWFRARCRKRMEGMGAVRTALKLVSRAMYRGPGARIIRFRRPSRK